MSVNKSFNTFPAVWLFSEARNINNNKTYIGGAIFTLAHRKILYYNLYIIEKVFLKRLHETLHYSFRNLSVSFTLSGALPGFKNHFYDLYGLF